jgi:xylulokinase
MDQPQAIARIPPTLRVMPFLLCLDLGTSAAKAALLDLRGTVRARADAAYPTHRAADGTAEQDPADWERAAREVITTLLGEMDGEELAGLALTGQMQDLVPVAGPGPVLSGPPNNARGSALDSGGPRTAILYSDTRAVAEAEELHRLLDAEGISWAELAGTEQDATSCAAMHLRLTRTAPERLAGLQGFVFGPAGHLVARMGLGLWCDPTTAATTGLLDARTRRWSPAVARVAGIDVGMLPQLTRTAGEVVGRVGPEGAALLGLPDGLPVVLAPGDAGATTCGIVGLEPGDAYAYLGTSGWLAAVLPEAPTGPVSGSSHHLALGATRGSKTPVLRISALLAAGAAADWARQAFLDGADTTRSDQQLTAREQERGRGPSGLLALPSILGERFPVRDASLRGAVLGMDAQTRGIDLYAAMLEGVAHGLAHGLDAVDGARAAGSDPVSPVGSDPMSPVGSDPASRPLPVTGGGAASEPWLRILADVTGRPVRTVDGADAALLGCALVAADALGLEHDLVPLGAQDGAETITPDPSAAARHAALRPAHRALYDAAAQVQQVR